jgi:hypothetical protein
MAVTMMGVHSLLEYPLWYAYFLLPTAFAWGVCLAPLTPSADARASRSTRAPSRGRASPLLRAGAALLVLGASFAVIDYLRVVHIFVPPRDAGSLAERIEAGQRSVFFAHHAHYASATTNPPSPETQEALRSATHFLLDARLMIAWARALDEAGEVDKARWVAARLREFKNATADSFFAECEGVPEGEAPPFQCEPPKGRYSFRDFR